MNQEHLVRVDRGNDLVTGRVDLYQTPSSLNASRFFQRLKQFPPQIGAGDPEPYVVLS